MLMYASLVSIRTRRTYSAEDRQISRPTSAHDDDRRRLHAHDGRRLRVFGRGRNLAGLWRRRPSRASAPCCSSRVLVVHLLVIGRYRLLELDLRVRRNVQYLVVSSAWTTLIVGAGLWFCGGS